MRMIVGSLLLGAMTLVAIGLAKNHVPSAEMLALPGAILASLYYTEGPHTGNGAPSWGYVVLALNLVIYSGAWFLALRLIRRGRRRDARSA